MNNTYEITIHNKNHKLVENELKKSIDTTIDYSYDEYVQMGKQLVKTVEVYQAKLAYLACKVCQIRHGGRSDGYYTITDYATDLGINPKTLQQWTLAYRNVLSKLDIRLEEVTKEVWRTANRVNDNLTWKNTVDNKSEGTHRKRLAYKKETPKELIQKMYYKESNTEPSFETEARVWAQSLRNMRNKIKKRDLSLTSENVLIDMSDSLEIINNTIKQFLKNKR